MQRSNIVGVDGEGGRVVFPPQKINLTAQKLSTAYQQVIHSLYTGYQQPVHSGFSATKKKTQVDTRVS